MHISGFHFQSSFLCKVSLALGLVALGDLLFFQWELGGSNLGFNGLALLGGMAAAQHTARRDRRAWLAAFMVLCHPRDGRRSSGPVRVASGRP